jgi:hypothetical protein
VLPEEAEEVRHGERVTVRPLSPDFLRIALIASTDFMKWKSNIRANIATIDSKTKTRLSDIKILCICDAILGLVPPSLATRPPFILRLLQQHKRPPALPAMHVGIAAKSFRTSLNLTGNVGTII